MGCWLFWLDGVESFVVVDVEDVAVGATFAELPSWFLMYVELTEELAVEDAAVHLSWFICGKLGWMYGQFGFLHMLPYLQFFFLYRKN